MISFFSAWLIHFCVRQLVKVTCLKLMDRRSGTLNWITEDTVAYQAHAWRSRHTYEWRLTGNWGGFFGGCVGFVVFPSGTHEKDNRKYNWQAHFQDRGWSSSRDSSSGNKQCFREKICSDAWHLRDYTSHHVPLGLKCSFIPLGPQNGHALPSKACELSIFVRLRTMATSRLRQI